MENLMEYELAQAVQRHYPLDWKEDAITHDLLIRLRDRFSSTTLEGLRYPLPGAPGLALRPGLPAGATQDFQDCVQLNPKSA